MRVSHQDPRLSWHGQVSLEVTKTYTRPWRIPFSRKALFDPALTMAGATPAGVRLAFQSSSRRVMGRILPLEENQKVDLCVDGRFFAGADLAGASEFAFEALPAGEKKLEFWLPQRGDFALTELELDEGATLAPLADERPRWITYGSSITHCGGAASPTRTWPAMVARERDLNLTCLGFGGQCHLDAQIARLMRDLPADHISICAGINIYGNNSLNSRSFRPALIGFVQILREKHPATPLLLISPVYSFERESTPNSVGWTLDEYRQAVAEVVGILQEEGDAHVRYLDGRELFSEKEGHLMPDRLHPDAEGYEVLGRNFLKRAAPLLFETT